MHLLKSQGCKLSAQHYPLPGPDIAVEIAGDSSQSTNLKNLALQLHCDLVQDLKCAAQASIRLPRICKCTFRSVSAMSWRGTTCKQNH